MPGVGQAPPGGRFGVSPLSPTPLDVLAAATSLRLHRRLASATEPRPLGWMRERIEEAGERAAAGTARPGRDWVRRAAEAAGGILERRPAWGWHADLPLVVADAPDRFVAFVSGWPTRRPPPGSSEDFDTAMAVGHAVLHHPGDAGCPDDERPIIYVPRYAAAASETYPARLEAIWFASAMLMPREAFTREWREAGGDPERAARASGTDIPAGLAFERAAYLGLA